jgi:glycerol-3-phosphate dehydrogenase
MAQYVTGLVNDMIGGLQKNPHFKPVRKRATRSNALNVEQKAALISKDPSYRKVVCRWETVIQDILGTGVDVIDSRSIGI